MRDKKLLRFFFKRTEEEVREVFYSWDVPAVIGGAVRALKEEKNLPKEVIYPIILKVVGDITRTVIDKEGFK